MLPRTIASILTAIPANKFYLNNNHHVYLILMRSHRCRTLIHRRRATNIWREEQTPSAHHLWYSNLASPAALLEKNQRRGGPATEAKTLTVSDGIKRKICTMDLYTRFSAGEAPLHDVTLPRIQILIGTYAVQCCVSNNDLMYCKHKILPPTMYNLLQEMGRVDRLLLATLDPTHTSFTTHLIMLHH